MLMHTIPLLRQATRAESDRREPTFLMATGFEQARSVVAAIVGDLEAAELVELDLPEMGACRLGTADATGAEDSCCGDAPAVATAVVAASAPNGACGTLSCGRKTVLPVIAAVLAAHCCA